MMSETYDLHCEFDIEKHKATYINYLEVVITEDGVVHYAVPSHQEYIINLAMQMKGCTRKEIIDLASTNSFTDLCNCCIDPITWLYKETKSVSVWNNFIDFYQINSMQLATLNKLRIAGLYTGSIPSKPMYQQEYLLELNTYPVTLSEIW